MTNQPDEKLSESAQKSEPPDHPLGLTWAAERFQFDPDLREPQPGVESLQKWLLNQDLTVALDAMLGPQTLAALERAVAADEGSAVVKDRLGIKDDDEFAQQTAEPDPTESSDDDSASARPVALSDSAIRDVSEDRLNFTPYVEAMAAFILAEQTRPPLAVAINAAWGQGKTSFMNMLDGQLKRAAEGTTTRVATTWFNPWKYSEPEQVWAAFVANVTRCVRANLTREQSWRFKWDRFVTKLKRHTDFALALRLTVALVFVLLVLTLPFTLDLPAFHAALNGKDGFLGAFYAATAALEGWLWWLLFVPFALLSLLYGYITFTKGLGLNLLEYVEKTDFKDKIGTLSQFESEMRRLAEAVPDDLKIVVFIDDLDRCTGKVLGEIIEALQLADVSRSCIFVLGMDLHIVAKAVENQRKELAHSAGAATQMEHGSGYKFLEKIIQARLTLPAHGPAQMEDLVSTAMAPAQGAGQAAAAAAAPGGTAPVAGTLMNRVRKGLGLAEPQAVTAPSDSDAVIRTAKDYGSRHFANPRRLKRFINGFRLQAYLTASVRPGSASVDRLARFLVLAEKWPAVVHYMLQKRAGPKFWVKEGLTGMTGGLTWEINNLPEEERAKLTELLNGKDGADPLEPADLKALADWYGFGFYREAAGGGA